MPNINSIDKINRILLRAFVIGAIIVALIPSRVFAEECEADGAYGQKCIYNKTFELEKKVRIKQYAGDSERSDDKFTDKITDVQPGDIIEFRIEIENIGEVEVDDMEMKDYLPDELKRVGGDDLEEDFDDFEPGDKVKFYIDAEIKDDEFDRDDNFEKCVVNKAKVEYDGDLEGSDTAIVCYGKGEVKELPETGATTTGVMTVLGLVSTGLGVVIRKRSELI